MEQGLFIYVDGPEKAGKTTLVNRLVERHGFIRRHWSKGPDAIYAKPLAEDLEAVAQGARIIWDRGWAAESVYSRLLNRPSRVAHDPWLAEWLHGRAAQAAGLRLMMLGPSARALRGLREADDLPVSPWEERRAFANYGRLFGYHTIANSHTPGYLDNLEKEVLQKAADIAKQGGRAATPAEWCGRPDAEILVIGDDIREPDWEDGRWLPFSWDTTLPRQLGTRAVTDTGWMLGAALASSDVLKKQAALPAVLVATTPEARYLAEQVAQPGQAVFYLPDYFVTQIISRLKEVTI